MFSIKNFIINDIYDYESLHDFFKCRLYHCYERADGFRDITIPYFNFPSIAVPGLLNFKEEHKNGNKVIVKEFYYQLTDITISYGDFEQATKGKTNYRYIYISGKCERICKEKL